MEGNYKSIFIVSGAALAIGAIIYFLRKGNTITAPTVGTGAVASTNPVALPNSTNPPVPSSSKQIPSIPSFAINQNLDKLHVVQPANDFFYSHWYGLYNPDDMNYWESSILAEVSVMLKRGESVNSISNLVQKHGLQLTESIPERDIYKYTIPNYGKQKMMEILNEMKLNNSIEAAEPSARPTFKGL